MRSSYLRSCRCCCLGHMLPFFRLGGCERGRETTTTHSSSILGSSRRRSGRNLESELAPKVNDHLRPQYPALSPSPLHNSSRQMVRCDKSIIQATPELSRLIASLRFGAPPSFHFCFFPPHHRRPHQILGGIVSSRAAALCLVDYLFLRGFPRLKRECAKAAARSMQGKTLRLQRTFCQL